MVARTVERRFCRLSVMRRSFPSARPCSSRSCGIRNFSSASPMTAITTMPAIMTSVLRNLRAPKIIQPRPQGTAASISTATKMRQACARPSRSPGKDVGQRAWQDHVAEQPAVIGTHRLRRSYPDFLYRFHAGPAVEDDRERRYEADQQYGRQISEPEPEQKQRRVGEARGSARKCSPEVERYPRRGANGPSARRW